MLRSGWTRFWYLAGACVTLAATVVVVSSKTSACASLGPNPDASCGTLTGADLIVDAVIVVFGLAMTAFFVARAVRARPTH